jgi:TFIIF-interacting CTD phosphatase-like protein
MQYKRDPTVQELTDLMPEVVFNVRPYSEFFLNEMAKYFEIIVFTAAEQAVSGVQVHPNFLVRR